MNQICNESLPIVTHDSKSNGAVTDSSNGLPRSLKAFYKKAYNINTKGHRPFSKQDFKNLSPVNYRQSIRRLGDLIEICTKSNPCLYKVKGIELPGSSHSVTDQPMGDTNQIIDILQSLRDQPACIHDIKVKFQSDNLHTLLVEQNCSVNPSNHSILVNFPSLDNNLTTKILVYPNTVQVDIGCTYKPIVYGPSGVYSLLEYLSKASFYLSQLTSHDAKIPEIKDWVITHYHFNKDGSETYNGQSFHYTIEDVSNGLIRYYSKQMSDGETIARAEQIQTPHRTISQELTKVLSQ